MTPIYPSGVPALVGQAAHYFTFPSTARVARHAARLWFQIGHGLSAAQFRDQHFRAHCRNKRDSILDRTARRIAFRRAFAQEVGKIVVEEGRLRAAAS